LLRGLAAAVAALIAAAVPLAGSAASPSPSPSLDLTVLRTALVGAPDGSWDEAPVNPDYLEGPLDAESYVDASWTDQATRDDVRGQLVHNRFLGAYARSFYNVTLDAWIAEDIKAFPNAADATSFWTWSMGEFHEGSSTVVSTPSIPSSFGDEYRNGDIYGIDIYFPKATYVLTVTTASRIQYLLDTSKTQATAVYAYAPSENLLPSAALPVAAHPNQFGRQIAFLETMVAIVAVVCVAAMVLLLVVSGRRRTAYATTISPDGKYWWDGSAWQPITQEMTRR
jgi:hypothetical protein